MNRQFTGRWHVTSYYGILYITYISASDEPLYNLEDVASINQMIECNGLKWQMAPANGSYIPPNWNVKWTDHEKNKRITSVHLAEEKLTGALDVSRLRNMQNLNCPDNKITELHLVGLRNLKVLNCSNNMLTSLDISGLGKLIYVDCFGNQLTSLDITGSPKLFSLLGEYQTVNLTLTWNNDTQQYEAPIDLNCPTNLARGIRYAEGKLIAKDASVPYTLFSVETGLHNEDLSGKFHLTYKPRND